FSGCRDSEEKGWSSRGTSAGRNGGVTGTTTDGPASPLRASRLAVMAANFTELTCGSPEMMRQCYRLWAAARRASQHGGYRSPAALQRLHPSGRDPNGARRRYKVLASSATAERTYPLARQNRWRRRIRRRRLAKSR